MSSSKKSRHLDTDDQNADPDFVPGMNMPKKSQNASNKTSKKPMADPNASRIPSHSQISNVFDASTPNPYNTSVLPLAFSNLPQTPMNIPPDFSDSSQEVKINLSLLKFCFINNLFAHIINE